MNETQALVSEEMLDVLGAPMLIKADGTGAPLFLAEHPIPPGYFVPPHVHADEDEMFYVLEGRLTLLDGVAERHAGPGSFVYLRKGRPHGFRNDSDGIVRFLVLCTPGARAAAMFRDLDRQGRDGGRLGPAEIGAICAAHGVRMV
jgi:mannose-6-phosphate isomerase-like protein (cupin superfamily)